MARHGVIAQADLGSDRFLELEVLSELPGLSQALEVSVGSRLWTEPLVQGWQRLSIELPAGQETVELRAARLLDPASHPDDPRELSVRLGTLQVHLDTGRHRAARRNQENNVLNMREMLEGRSELSSAPFSLGIDIHGACNIKPPCVYCPWDEQKRAEGELADMVFSLDTLESYGELYSRASRLLSCCFGEPFMLRELDQLLDRFSADAKVLEMSTNGQVLTDRHIESLVGRPISLYISIDAATAGTYARLRNRHFDRVVDNVRRLTRAKGGRGRLPEVLLVFMPIRANHHELDAFVDLCAELEADRMVLRALDAAELSSRRIEREGHVFDYHSERLPLEQLIRLAGRAEALCRRAGVPFSNQLDFGGTTGERFNELLEAGRREVEIRAGTEAPEPEAEVPSEPSKPSEPPEPHTPCPVAPAPDEEPPAEGDGRVPLCTEPWRSLYILRRGVLPCCYGGVPLAPMHEHGQAWNGETLRSIRAALAAGRFHDYCLRSPSCPVVSKHELAGRLDRGERRWLALRRAWHRLNRMSGGIPHAVVRPALDRLVPALRSLLGRRSRIS
jgi:MoaA/NifB/PqqE/SkfB family radical SAM enzyme